MVKFSISTGEKNLCKRIAWLFFRNVTHYIYIFIAIARDESIFLDVLHFPMKNITSRDLEATPIGGATSKPIQ